MKMSLPSFRIYHLVLVLSIFLFAGVPTSQAGPSEQDVKQYIDSVLQKSQSKVQTVEGINLDNPRQLPFQGGNNMFALLLQLEMDHIRQIFDFYLGGGMRWAIVGMCIRCTSFGCSFYPYQKYHYPNEMVEIKGTLQGEYTLDFIMMIYEMLLDGVGYDIMEALTPMQITYALSAGGNLKGILDLPSSADIDFIKDLPIDRLKGHYRGAGGMARHSQFWSTMAMATGTPFAPLGNCHDEPQPMMPSFMTSESIFYHTITNISFISHFLNPDESIFMHINPTACVGHNIASGFTPNSAPFNRIALPAAKSELCIPGLPAQYPAGQRMSNVRSSPNALQGMLMPANHAFRAMHKPMKSDFAYSDEGNISADTIQWRQPAAIKCGPTGKLGENADFTEEGYDPSDVRNDPDRAVGTLWKFMRCCPKRYNVLFGPRPQRKGMEDFQGSKL